MACRRARTLHIKGNSRFTLAPRLDTYRIPNGGNKHDTIELYTAPPPNGHKACCTPEALKLEYNNHFINISKGKLRTLEFRAINPKGRVPAIIDRAIYRLYGREAAPEVEKVGSFVGYFGAVISDLDPSLGFDASWNAVVMPVYHRRRACLDLQRSTS